VDSDMSRVRVFIVDDHHMFRMGVRAALEPFVDVIGDASEVDPAVEMIVERLPDVVLLDVHMPAGGGKAVLERVRERHPDVRFLALSASDTPEDVVAIIRAGARGYVTKNIDPELLVDAVKRVAEGDSVFSPRLAGFVLDAFASIGGHVADPEVDQLTPREKEVLRLIALGDPYKEVSARLAISSKTVERHVSAVLHKLQLSNRHELARWPARSESSRPLRIPGWDRGRLARWLR
jgi:DNA-binding NarL/FixJ family response regulator